MRARILAFCIIVATFSLPVVLDAQGQIDRILSREALVALRDANIHLLQVPWVYGIGIGEGKLRLYIDKRVVDNALLDTLKWRGIRAPEVVTEFEASRFVEPPIRINAPHAFGAAMGSSTSNSGACYTGTLGFTAIRESDGNFGYVTTNHVAAAQKNRVCPNIGNAPRQVSPSTGMHDCHNGSTIGRLELPLVVIDFTGTGPPNYVDAAFVSQRGSGVNPQNLCGIPWSATTIPPNDVHTNVLKCGATTKRTEGTIQDSGMDVKVRFQCGLETVFQDQIAVWGLEVDGVRQRFSDFGDSGSLVVTENAEVVGLVFAGDDRFTYINPIGKVLSMLHVRLCPMKPCQ